MAKNASEIAPKFVPEAELMGRDDSGGPDFEPRTAQFGDGGKITGAKSYLSASGGGDDKMAGDEISRKERGK